MKYKNIIDPIKTCGNCAHLCDDRDFNGRLFFLCGTGKHMWTPLAKGEGKDVKFDSVLSETLGKALEQLRKVFYGKVYCDEHEFVGKGRDHGKE